MNLGVSHAAFVRTMAAPDTADRFWTTAGVGAVLILAVMIQSIWGVTVAGARSEASRLIIMMTRPFTVGMSVAAIGAAMAMGWWRSRRQPAASGND